MLRSPQNASFVVCTFQRNTLCWEYPKKLMALKSQVILSPRDRVGDSLWVTGKGMPPGHTSEQSLHSLPVHCLLIPRGEGNWSHLHWTSAFLGSKVNWGRKMRVSPKTRVLTNDGKLLP